MVRARADRPAVFYGMLRANYQRVRELESRGENADRRIAELERQLEGRRKDQALADLLTGLYRFGVTDILNKPPDAGGGGIAEWDERERQWTESVLTAMRKGGCTLQELNHVEIIGLFPLLALHPSDTISRDLSMFAVRLSRVADISTKYAK
jgi:hypothetical protein